MLIFNFTEIIQRAKTTFMRFPVALTWAILGTLYIISIVKFDSELEYNIREIAIIILGTSWLIGTHFLIEQHEKSKRYLWLFVIIMVLLATFYIYLPKENTFENPIRITRFILYLLAGHLFLIVSPFFNFWNRNAFWNFLKSVILEVVRSLLFSIVLFLGISLALLAIHYLFDTNIKGERYLQIFIFCIGIINTWIFLSGFPKNIKDQTLVDYHKVLEVFVKYILIPLVILYVIILYAYCLKIIITWNLPKGWGSYLVIALSFLGFIIQTVIDPIQKTLKSPMINRFYPWFYYLLLPLLILLFAAIFTRIGDYGITENRYFLLVLAFWITGVTLYLILSNDKRLKILPISLIVLMILSSVGFWSAFNVSKTSQFSEFKVAFTNVKANNNIATGEEYETLESIMRYFHNREKLHILNPVVGVELDSVYPRISGMNHYYLDTSFILDSLSILKPKDYHTVYNHVSIVLDKSNLNTKIGDFQTLNYVSFGKDSNKIDSIYTFDLIDKQSKAVIKSNATILYELQLNALIKDGLNESHVTLTEEDLTFHYKNDHIEMKIIIESLEVNVENEIIYIENLNAILLVK
jgi:hypothetical protein